MTQHELSLPVPTAMTTILLRQEVRRKSSLPARRWWLLAGLVGAAAVVFFCANLSGEPSTRFARSAGGISLPAEPNIEAVLSDYLFTEPILEGGSNLDPDVIKRLKVSIYTVKKGDSLSSIAQLFGLSMDTIISFNGIKSSKRLLAGAKLDIPNRDGLRYQVKRGDSLEKIAKGFGTTVLDLAKWNNLESDIIIQGQEIFVPDARLSVNELNLVLGKLFVYPTKGRLTSGFGYRSNPITGTREFHTGIDLAGKVGTAIRASMAGNVAAIGVAPIYGKYIILRHADGFQTLYGHLDKIGVAKGERIEQGQKIGEMGNTGFSTGSHLHFTIYKNGIPVDPFA